MDPFAHRQRPVCALREVAKQLIAELLVVHWIVTI